MVGVVEGDLKVGQVALSLVGFPQTQQIIRLEQMANKLNREIQATL